MKRKTNRVLHRFKSTRKQRGDESSVKREVYGLLLFAIGVLFFLAVLSYHQTDPVFWSLNDKNQYTNVQNFLGVAGATVARPVFTYTFGYPSVVFPLLVMIIGIALMANYSLLRLWRFMLLSIVWAYFISVVLAMPEALRTYGVSLNYYPSGMAGGLTADLITRFFGRFALMFISAIFFLILLMITFRFRLSIIPIYIGKLLKQGILATVAFFRSMVKSARDINWKPFSTFTKRPFRVRKRKPVVSSQQETKTETEDTEPVHSFSDLDEYLPT
ncbi:MAG: hypothetical protein D6748_09005, partial [Calditrichaeota bacterium]